MHRPIPYRWQSEQERGRLQALNSLLLLVLCVYLARNSFFGLILALPLFFLLFAASTIYHLLAVWVDRRVSLSLPVRLLLYLLPVLTVSGGLLIAAWMPQPPNRRTPAVSPSSAYVLTMPIEQGLWRVTIRDRKGKLLYRDDSEFIGQLSVYWTWDDQDRVWLYNSDDSAVYFWEKTPHGWRRIHWGHGRKREIPRELTPPAALYPDYG
jgi:hypothetical protein